METKSELLVEAAVVHGGEDDLVELGEGSRDTRGDRFGWQLESGFDFFPF